MAEFDSNSAGYDLFACIYDAAMAGEFARRIFPVIERLLLRELAPGCRVLDLCCGSGRLARRLCESGLRVTGLDRSEAMIRLARANSPGVPFFLADARCFAVAIRQAAVICAFNSLAHFHSVEDLRRVFARVRTALEAGGSFLFDLTMHEAYASRWRGSYRLEAAGQICVIRPAYNASTGVARNDIEIFPARQLCGAHAFPVNPATRFTIFQKCHSEAEIRTGLAEAGFGCVQSFDAEHDLGIAGEYGRRFFLAQ